MTDAEIKELIKKLPLWAKTAQLTQLNASFLKEDSRAELTGLAGKDETDNKYVAEIGSVLNFYNAKEQKEIQNSYLEKSQYKIPLIFMMDVIHGYRTIYPVPLAIGCSFDEKLAEDCAEMSAIEAKYDGVQITFAPMVDLVRDARWGRCMESTGEDSYLNGKMARAMIRGYKKGGLGTCIKHFACYGAAEAGREYNNTDLSCHTMREYYLRGYEEALKEKPEMVMTSFNSLNGAPVNGHSELLVDLLRKEWKFGGVVISDYAAVTEMITHGYLESEKECARIAANNGIDIEMMSFTYIKHLEELVKEGKVSEEQIDEMLFRVLKLKNQFGLFENPCYETDEKKAESVALCAKHRELARIAAEKSCVLLKNDGVLPLEKRENIALVGPFACEKNIIGAWHCRGDQNETVSIAEGVENYLGRKINAARGCSAELLSEDLSGIDEAKAIAKTADTVIVCIGEKGDDSGEGASRAKLEITRPQEELVKSMKDLGKKVVSVVFGGRPQVLTDIEKYSDAILYVWQPGTEGGNAIANILFGKVNPSAKLAMSFPRTTGQCPIYYNAYSTGRPRNPDTQGNCYYNSSYRDCLNSPLYPFGYGLSYTSFKYSEPELSADTLEKDGRINISVSVKNTGKYYGEETVQLYIRDLFASSVRPVKELKGYKKIALLPNEVKKVMFTIDEDTLKFYTASGKFAAEPGDFEIMIGSDSVNLQKKKISLI